MCGWSGQPIMHEFGDNTSIEGIDFILLVNYMEGDSFRWTWRDIWRWITLSDSGVYHGIQCVD